MTEIIDISLPLSSKLPVWPGNKPFSLESVNRMDSGDHCNESIISTNIHTGTHIDVPWHFVKDGEKTDAVEIAKLIGRATVIHIPGVGQITPEHLDSADIDPRCDRLLLRTDNSKLWDMNVSEFKPDFVALTEEAAEWIAERGFKLVGIDYLSIQLFGGSNRTHEALLEAGVIILEGINLSEVSAGDYELLCLPLAIKGAEGAPARAVLRK